MENGAVRVAGDRIIELGPAETITATSERIIDLGDYVLLPGLLNAHCHFDYTCMRGQIPAPSSFTEWIRAINAEKASLTAPDYLRSIAEGLEEAKAFGT